YTFAVYLILIFGISWNFYMIVIIVIFLFTLLTLVNLKGVKESATFINVLVVIKFIILLLFIFLGIVFTLRKPNQMINNVGLNNESFYNINIMGIILGSACILISYEGFQLIAYGAHEMEDVEEGVNMMKWAVGISMLLYCLVGFTAIAVLGTSGLIGENVHDSEVAIAYAALNFMGTYGMLIIIIGALLSTSSALNATILGSSRLSYMMSKDKVLPKSLSKMSKNKVPYISVIVTSVLSLIITIFTGGALAIAGLASLIFAQIFFIINYTNFKVRKTTESNAFIPIIGMILTAGIFIIYLTFSIIDIEHEIYALISFIIMESATVFFVIHIKKKNLRTENKA
ncbi:MAG: APC family permease, partial [Candidatus Hermodarchaeota archaeon]